MPASQAETAGNPLMCFASSVQAVNNPHLCIIWLLFSVAIGSTERATNSCICLLIQMPADKME